MQQRIVVVGHDNDPRRRMPRHDSRRGAETVDARHGQIHQHDIRLLCLVARQGVATVGALDDLGRQQCQDADQEPKNTAIIFDDEQLEEPSPGGCADAICHERTRHDPP